MQKLVTREKKERTSLSNAGDIYVTIILGERMVCNAF